MNNESMWYEQLVRPEWAPPSWLFGPVWTFLYAFIAISYGIVFHAVWKKRLPQTVAIPFILNIIFNAAFTPLQFGLRNNLLASVDILLVLATIIWMVVVIWPHKRYRYVAYMQIPYFLWVSFATVLQLTITYMNW